MTSKTFRKTSLAMIIVQLAVFWFLKGIIDEQKLEGQKITTISVNNETNDVTFKHKGTTFSILNTKECMLVKLTIFKSTLDEVMHEVIELGPKDPIIGLCFVKKEL